jgi:hypothetical protein
MKPLTTVPDEDYRHILHVSKTPEWTQVWHSWTVLVPRRTISGRLVWGHVLRRHDGRRWIYKKLAA